MNAIQALKALITNEYPKENYLTERGKQSLSGFYSTQEDIKKRGVSGLGGRGNPLTQDIKNANTRGFSNWRDLEADILKRAKERKPEILGATIKPSRVVSNSKVRPLSREEIRKVLDNYGKFASITAADPRLTYRTTPEKASKNAEYVKKYVRTLMKEAPKYNLDPVMMAAISAQESGWGGQRLGNNLLGYGELGSGTPEESMGIHYNDMPYETAIPLLLDRISKAYGGIYTNRTTPEEFTSGKYKWNTHQSWIDNVNLIKGSLTR